MTLHRHIFCIITLALVVAATTPTEAQSIHSIDLDGERVNFVVPAGYCVLDTDRPAERFVFDSTDQSLRPRSQLILYFAECDVLHRFRSDIASVDLLTPFGIYYVPIDQSGRFKTEARLSRAEFAAYIYGLFPTVDVEAVYEEKSEQSREILGDPTANLDVQYFGATHHDNNAIYLSFQGNETSFGESYPIFGEGFATLIHERAVTAMFYNTIGGVMTRQEATAIARSLLVDLLEVNPDSDN